MTAHLSPARVPSLQGHGKDPHRSLHSETGGDDTMRNVTVSRRVASVRSPRNQEAV